MLSDIKMKTFKSKRHYHPAWQALRCHRRAYVLRTVFFFCKLSPLSFDNGCTDLKADRCVNTVDEKIPTAKNFVNFGKGTLPQQPILWRETATSWHETPSLFVLALYNSGEDRTTYTHTETLEVPSTNVKNFVNFCAVNRLDIVVSWQKAW